jgi:hypothetical protein
MVWRGPGDREARAAGEIVTNPYPERSGYLPIIYYKPAPTPTPEPVLQVGDRHTWDGKGFLRVEEYKEVGTHLVRKLDMMTAPNTIRSSNRYWYDPNPNHWEEETWYAYYSPVTARFLSSSATGDPAWKFGFPWVMPTDWHLAANKTHEIDRQEFRVSGPIDGFTAFGRPVRYWRLENKSNILYWSDGGSWTQVVRPGNLELHYDAGPTRLLLFSDVLRSYYYNGSSTGYNVQYAEKLTSSNAFTRYQAGESIEEQLIDWQFIARPPLEQDSDLTLPGVLPPPESMHPHAPSDPADD